jgi:hypothetical protein
MQDLRKNYLYFKLLVLTGRGEKILKNDSKKIIPNDSATRRYNTYISVYVGT